MTLDNISRERALCLNQSIAPEDQLDSRDLAVLPWPHRNSTCGGRERDEEVSQH